MICTLTVFGFTLLISLTFFIIGLIYRYKWKIMRDTPTRKVVDIEPGRVEVKGKVNPLPGQLLTSPLTRSSCVSYKVEVQEYRSSGKSGYWATINKNEKGDKFLLTDDSGSVMINPKGAGLNTVQTMSSEQGLFSKMNDHARNYIERLGIGTMGTFGVLKRSLKVVEHIVPAYVDMYVLGTAVDIPLPAGLDQHLLISPFTIKKKGVMILSYKSEEKLSKKKKTVWVIMFTLAVLSVIFGILGMIKVWGF